MRRISSTDSSFAGRMKAQVFTTMTPARSGRSVTLQPERDRRADMTSLSTRFFGQPRLRM